MFEIYKRGQGTRARWVAAIALGALAVFGCYSLQDFIGGYTEAKVNLGFMELSVSVLVSAIGFLLAGMLIALIYNHKRFVDYLISSETELKKVSWPTRADLKRQTVIVIATIVVFSALLFVADLFFAYGSKHLYGF